jgi:RHS repeat-associated protein
VTIGGKVYAQTQIIDPNVNATTYVYDGLGRLWTDTNQLGKTRTYKYDAIGNQLEVIDRNGTTRTFEYDNLNRQTKENWVSAGTVTRSFTSQYDVVNRLIDVTDQSIAGGVGTKLSQYGYAYDDLDRLKTIDNLGVGGVARVLLTYGYDANGNIKSVTDSIAGTLSGTTAYNYDALNRATQITQSGIGITNKRVNMTYNAVGQMETLQRFTGNQSVATSTYSYNDPLNRLTQIQHANATGATLASFAFTYDNGSRIRKITNADGTFVNYDYANNDELKGADYSPTNRIDEAYTYDANGNRTNAGYVTGGNNQLSADAKYDYTYDDEGNLKTRRDRSTNITRTFNWDYRNRLVSVVEGGVTIAAYAYDANNQRISKTTGGVTTRYVYDRSNVALEFTGLGTTPTVRYFYGTRVDQILAQDKGSGNVSWQLTDQLGSVRVLVRNDGVVQNRFEYDAFGNVVSTMPGATDDSRYRYTGREFDAETGLNYYRARYFDSFSGRFIGQDPIGFDSGDGTNLYAYVRNTPTSMTDPTGLYGAVVQQERSIQYETVSGERRFTNNIIDVIFSKNFASLNTGFSRMISDATTATITHSPIKLGTPVDPLVRLNVPGINPQRDDAGHIIGAQLGGSGSSINNLFAQNRQYNRGWGGDTRWRIFEDNIRAQVDFQSPLCPCFMQVRMYVNLEYDLLSGLRPTAFQAAFYTSLNGIPFPRNSGGFLNFPNPL